MKLAISLLLLPALGVSGERLTWSQEEDWRNRIKAALYVGAPPALEPEAHGSFEPVPGVVAERVTYGTQFGMRVPAILYRPKSAAGKIPGLIVVNGHGGDKYSWYAFYSGVLYARAGAAVLTYDPAGEGERNIARKSGTRAHDNVEPPDELAQRLGGLMMTDVMQAVSYLSRRPEVDPRRLGAFGYSMGSFVLSLAGAVERRLKTCVLVGGGNLDGPGEYWDKSKPMCQGVPYRSLLFLGDRPAAIYALHASRGPTLVFNGLADTTVQIPKFGEAGFKDLHQRVAALRGSAEGIFETGFVPGAAHRPYFVTKPVALWLEKHLDFPNWTEESIRAMPETHISEWARANGVAMDPLYSNEQREGGARALGEGVPGLSRADLSVFTPAEWERRKDRLIHETWLKEAKARIARNAAPLEGLRAAHPRLLLLDGELAQLDLGSFVLDAGGTRWALDFGRNNYQVPNYFGSLRFTYCRTRTESHNTVLIDGQNQDLVAEAPIFAHRFEAELAFVRIDLAKTYPGKLKRFERGMALVARKHVIVQDEISAARPVEALWGMVTGAEVRLRGSQAELHESGWVLRASILSPPGAKFGTVSTEVAPPQDQNGDTRKLIVRLPGKITDVKLTVALTPHRAEQTPPRLAWQDRPLARW